MRAIQPHCSLAGIGALLLTVYMVHVLIKAWRNGVIDDGEFPATRYVRSVRPFVFWAVFMVNVAAMAGLAAFGLRSVFGSGD